MNSKLICGDCSGELEEGYILEETKFIGIQFPIGASHWVEGKLQSDLNIDGKRKYVIKAFRCKNCGLLKFFANR